MRSARAAAAPGCSRRSSGPDRAAMHAGERMALAKIVEILEDGLRGDLEAARQVVDRHPAERAGELHDFGLPAWNGHRSDK